MGCDYSQEAADVGAVKRLWLVLHSCPRLPRVWTFFGALETTQDFVFWVDSFVVRVDSDPVGDIQLSDLVRLSSLSSFPFSTCWVVF